MAETSTVYSGGGWTPSGSRRVSRRVRQGAMKYLLGSLIVAPLIVPRVGVTAARTSMARTVSSRWSGKEFAKAFAWEAVPVVGTPRNLVAMRGLSGRAAASRAAGMVTGQVTWTAAYAYAAKTIASRDFDRDQGGRDLVTSRGGSRRRRFADEYAYKF